MTVDIQRQIRGAVIDALGEVAMVNDQDDLAFDYGSTRVAVSARGLVDGINLVWVSSITNYGLERTAPLYRYVAHHGHKHMTRLTTYDTDDGTCNVVLEMPLVFAVFEPNVFLGLLSLFAETADQVDDEVRELFGGERWID